jgi:hypothetical protein
MALCKIVEVSELSGSFEMVQLNRDLLGDVLRLRGGGVLSVFTASCRSTVIKSYELDLRSRKTS